MTINSAQLANIEKLSREKPLAAAKCARFDERLAQGHSIAIIQLQYSYLCNFHCSHCSIAGFRARPGARKLDIPTVKRVMDEADAYGLAHIGISGGEPLVFNDLPELIDAIGPERFHIQLDTNGWFMTDNKAKWVKSLGVDKVQISLDGLDPLEHDTFRRKPGSYQKALEAIGAVQAAGLSLQIATVVDHARAQGGELEAFLSMMKTLNVPTSVVYAKPVGEWAGRYDLLCTPEDIRRVKALLDKYGGYDHTSPQYGRDLGCIAVKRMVSITAYGDVLPCPWMYWSLGNIFNAPLAFILDKGMRYFKTRNPLCRMSEDREFMETYVSKLDGRTDLPLTIEEVMGER